MAAFTDDPRRFRPGGWRRPAGIHRIPLRGRMIWRAGAPAVRAYAARRWNLRLERTAPLPTGGFIYTGNHPSSIDPVLVAAMHGRPIPFLAVDELYGRYRSLDLALRWFGAVPVARRGVPLAAMRLAVDHLRAGGVMGVFPEGTRVPEWRSREAKPGAAWLAVRTGRPIVPVAITGSSDVFTMDLRFEPGTITIITGPPLHPRGVGRPAVVDLNLRWLEWMDRILT